MEGLPAGLAEVAAHFRFIGNITGAKPYGEGHINDTYLITAQDGPQTRRYILQKINTNVFKQPAQLMENLVAVTEYLGEAIRAAGGNPLRETLNVIHADDGKGFYIAPDDGFWRAYYFIEDAVSFQMANQPGLFAAAARAFGNFARLLGGFPAATLHETIPQFHDTRVRLQNLENAVKADAKGRAAECQKEIDFVMARKADCAKLMDMLDAGELPLRVTHNDTKLNNVLIDPKTMEGVAVIDLDTVMPGLIANDFGDAIRSGATTAAEDEPDLDKVQFSLDLYETYAQNYLRALEGTLTAKEKEMLPWGAKLMTLECGMRFLTDHLEGDSYFKIHRPGHNLDRARTQLKLVADMEANWEKMAL